MSITISLLIYIMLYHSIKEKTMNNIIILYNRKKTKMKFEKLLKELEGKKQEDYTIKEAEKLAKKVLNEGEYDNVIGATPIIKIAKDFGFECYKANNMPSDISGNIFVGGTTSKFYESDKVIIVGTTEKYEHQRFIIAHELAHYLIDYLGSDKSKNPNKLFTRTYPKENHKSFEEIRADRFSAELLMPSNIFLRQYVKAMEASDCNKNFTISHLAKFFKVKSSSVDRRIDEVIS